MHDLLELPCRIVSVEDGDTFLVAFDTEDGESDTLPDSVLQATDGTDAGEAYVRCPDIDTRETYTRAGRDDKRWVEDWVQTGRAQYDGEYPFVAYTLRESFQTGSYGRVIAKLARRSDWDDLETSVLTARGTAVGWWD